MALKLFWDNVRSAAKFVPAGATVPDAKPLDAAAIEDGLRKSVNWLVQRSVAGFDPADFDFLPEEVRVTLTGNVKAFREAAPRVPPEQPPAERIEKALPPSGTSSRLWSSTASPTPTPTD